MRFRKLRIAWSVGCGVACVMLIVLWVRSYWCAEIVSRLSPRWTLTVGSNHGIIYFVYESPPALPKATWYQPIAHSNVSTPYWSYARIEVVVPVRWVELKSLGNIVLGQIPHFLLVGLCVPAAVVPWWPKRYSLRTLLIATTLVAVVLGVIVWAARN
jgi:hypothetical protein